MAETFPSLTGRWIGRYDYGPGLGSAGTAVAFEAELLEEAGQLTGRTAEPNAFRPDQGHVLVARVQGGRSGLSVQFVKIYLGFDQGAHPVYDGQADAGLIRVTGQWRFTGGQPGSGRFVMLREPRAAARQTRKAQVPAKAR